MKSKLLFTAIFSAIINTLSAQQTLTYSDHESQNEMRTKFLREVFFPEIAKQTKDRIKIQPSWDGKLASSYKALDSVASGKTVDITTVVPEYAAEKLPTHQIFKSFLKGPTGDRQVQFFRQIYRTMPEFTQELHNNNLEPVFLSTGYGVGFFSTKPMQNLNELKTQKWRTASFWHRDFLQNFGSTPVTIPWGEQVYKAFENKTLDGLMVNVDGGYQLKVYEQAPYILASKNLWLGHLYIVAMNKTTWDKLSTKDKNAIRRAAKIAYRKLGKVTDESFDTQMQKLQQAGASYRILTDTELIDFQNKAKQEKVQKKWVSEQKAKGLKNIDLIYEKIRKLLQ